MNAPAPQGIGLTPPTFVKNAKLVAWVAEMVALCKPAAVHWCDGSDAEYQQLCQGLVAAGTFKQLNPAKRPNSFLACSDPAFYGKNIHSTIESTIDNSAFKIDA